MADALRLATEYGLPGLIAFVLALALRAIYNHSRSDRIEHAELIKDKDQRLEALSSKLSTEQRLRVEDAKRFTEVALGLQSQVISSVASIEKASSENAKLCGFVERLVHALESGKSDHGTARKR